MIKEKSCGAVTYYIDNGKIYYLIEHMKMGHYSIPKGHVENNETEVETTLREIKEETNLDVEVDTTFRETISYSPYKGCMKDVVFFVAKTKSMEVKNQEIEVSEISFLPFNQAIEKLTFDSDKKVLEKANKYIENKENLFKDLGVKTYMFPMPVLILGSFDEENTPNAMNAAWGGTYDSNQIFICLASDHKSTKNILANNEFTVAFATSNTIEISDYVGIVSGNEVKDKVAKANMSYVKSKNINAPVFTSYPITLECKVNHVNTDDSGETTYLVADIINVLASHDVLDESGKIDICKANFIIFDPAKNGYHIIDKKVGTAFKDGLKIKKK